MNPHFKKHDYAIAITGSIIFGFLTYFALSYLYIVPKITIPISIVVSMLIFGLTKFYAMSSTGTNYTQDENSTSKDNHQNDPRDRNHKGEDRRLSSILFVTIFSITILISSFTYGQDFHLFINWNVIGGIEIIQLGAAIMLCFFVPGYGIVLIITKKYKMDPILAVLLAYLLSMLITGLTAYIATLSFDSAISESKNLFIAVYLVILVSILIRYPLFRIRYPINLRNKYFLNYNFASAIIIKFWKYLRTRASEILVFGSLFALLIISTYLLYGGVTIGDQWYHQGRALLFMNGSFREAIFSGGESYYPPFQSALLAALTTLSGLPLVNSYASIAFLNITPVFAFYFFFRMWVPTTMRKAGLLACSLFTISAGFGWIYLFNITNTTNPITSQQSILDTLVAIRPLDIIRTSNFVIPTAPDFSTALIYIALPAGFVLLGLLRMKIHSKFTNIGIVIAISTLGIISHYEFYFFIIVASLLPLIFKMKEKNYVYIGLLFAFSIVFLLDITIPGKLFTENEIFGLPLLFLNILFVVFTWTIYLTGERLEKVIGSRSIFPNASRKLVYRDVKSTFAARILIISVIAYVYLLSFIVVTELSIDVIMEHASQNNVPWYLYPMRMGLAGIAGLAFILSYLFKRFEKELFVFGVIVVIAFVTGTFYDEHRFSKYTMAGMIAFASLMIYKIINRRFKYNSFSKVTLIGIIVISSGLSILIFVGYNSLILQTHDYAYTQKGRNFPSMSELNLLELLHERIDLDSEKYNVISFPSEYSVWEGGVMPKIQGFSGLPYDKLFTDPLTLNASTLDGLYRLLAYSDARYIILPKEGIKVDTRLTEPTRFVLDYFNRIYEDDNYIVLEVPPLQPQTFSPKPGVGLVYNHQDDILSPKVSDIRLLKYNNTTFDIKAKNESGAIQKQNGTEGIKISGSNMDRGIRIWSKNFTPEAKVNHIEIKFRISSENQSKNNDIRLNWLDSDKEYYTSFSENGLDLYQKSIDNVDDRKILSRNNEMEKRNGIWYTLRLEIINNSINVYMNDILAIQASRDNDRSADYGITKVGFTSYYNDVVIKPIKIASISESAQKIHNKTKYYDYYYPLSLLALSKTKYDIFRDGDLSAFSKDVILTTDNLKVDNATFNKYLDYAREGGKLVVLNSNGNFSGKFSKLFSIRSNESNQDTFTSIIGNKNQSVLINVTGLVQRAEMQSFPDVNLIASYINNNQTLAPFIIEKVMPNGGKIVLVNARGYFNALSDLPTQYFFTLTNISKLLALNSHLAENSQNVSIPQKGFTENMEVSGQVSLNSSSLSLYDKASYPYNINATHIAISNKINGSKSILDNVSIKDLKLAGAYEIIINFTGKSKLPDMISNRNYISMFIPTNFNMTINPSAQRPSHIEIIVQNHSLVNSIKVDNASKIDFYNIKDGHTLKSIPVILKSPNIKVNGNTTIKHSNFGRFIELMGALDKGTRLDVQGRLEAKINSVDHYYQPFENGTRTTYVTFLQSVTMDGSIHQDEYQFKLPGDISLKAKENGEDIPLKKILTSSSNIILIILITITIIGIWLIKRLHPR